MIVLGGPGLGFLGGVERHVHDLAVGLRARGHRVGLVHGDAVGRERERYARAFDAVAPTRQARDLLRDAHVVYLHKLSDEGVTAEMRSGARLLVAIHDHDATCVRRHRYLPLSKAPCSYAPGLHCVCNGCVVVRDRAGLVPVALRDPFALLRSTRRMSRRATLVTCSEFLRGTLVNAGVAADRILVVRPVPPPDATPTCEPPDDPVLAFVGQIVRGKGLDLLIEAMASLPAATLLVAGAGPSLVEEKLRAERLGVVGRVTFLGPVAPEAVRPIYDRARVVVVPSRWPEPFGMVGIEAMRRRRIVVAANHGGIPEWLSDGVTGEAFEPCSVADMVRALRLASRHPRHEALVAAAAERANAEFSFDSMLEGVEAVLGLRDERR